MAKKVVNKKTPKRITGMLDGAVKDIATSFSYWIRKSAYINRGMGGWEKKGHYYNDAELWLFYTKTKE